MITKDFRMALIFTYVTIYFSFAYQWFILSIVIKEFFKVSLYRVRHLIENAGSISKGHYHSSHTAADQRVFNASSGLAIILHLVFTATDPLGPTVFINFWNMANFYTAGAFCSVRGSHGHCVPVVFIKRPALKVKSGPSGASDNHAWATLRPELLSVSPPLETLTPPQWPRNSRICSKFSHILPHEPWPTPLCGIECGEIYGISKCESQWDCKMQFWGFIEAMDQRKGQSSVWHTMLWITFRINHSALSFILYKWTGKVVHLNLLSLLNLQELQ